MSTAAVFVAKFRTSDGVNNNNTLVAKVGVDINDSIAPHDFYNVFDNIANMHDGDLDSYDGDAYRTFSGQDYYELDELILDHPEYFTIRWYELIYDEESGIPEMENLIRINWFE